MSRTILLLHGPNLNLLGQREAEHYGRFTLADVESHMDKLANGAGYRLDTFQSNSEGALIDYIQAGLSRFGGMLINAGALSHYSYALLDALLLCNFPIVEIHISDIENREPFRNLSVIRPACVDCVAGLGFNSYPVAWKLLLSHLEETKIER